jgi:hypothetical protein
MSTMPIEDDNAGRQTRELLRIQAKEPAMKLR